MATQPVSGERSPRAEELKSEKREAQSAQGAIVVRIYAILTDLQILGQLATGAPDQSSKACPEKFKQLSTEEVQAEITKLGEQKTQLLASLPKRTATFIGKKFDHVNSPSSQKRTGFGKRTGVDDVTGS